MTNFFLERKKNGQIQELISNMRLILSYTVQLVIPNVCTKFQNPKSSSFREIFDRKKLTNTHAHTQTEKAKTIYPLHTSYSGGINMKREREIFVRTDEVQETVKNFKIKNKIREQLNKKLVWSVHTN